MWCINCMIFYKDDCSIYCCSITYTDCKDLFPAQGDPLYPLSAAELTVRWNTVQRPRTIRSETGNASSDTTEKQEQENIPVGCVPPAFVVPRGRVSWIYPTPSQIHYPPPKILLRALNICHKKKCHSSDTIPNPKQSVWKPKSHAL